MIRYHTKFIGLVVLLIGLAAVQGPATAAKSDSELPVRTVTITVDNGTRDQFFDQLKKFADTYALAIRIAPTRPDVPHFLVQMWREDMKVVGANPFDDSEFDISFYKNGDHPIEPAVLNQVVVGLKQAVEKIPGATISEAK